MFCKETIAELVELHREAKIQIHGWQQLYARLNIFYLVLNLPRNRLSFPYPLSPSLRSRRWKGTAKEEFGRAREKGKEPSSLLPRARSRALIPFPFPIERLHRRLPLSKVTKCLQKLSYRPVLYYTTVMSTNYFRGLQCFPCQRNKHGDITKRLHFFHFHVGSLITPVSLIRLRAVSLFS